MLDKTATDSASRGRLNNKWLVVGLLWFCGFFNYADRQAITAVFPLLTEEFHLTKTQLGWLGTSFMIIYSLASPVGGWVVDRYSRRWLVFVGLSFWSLICALTGTARSYLQLLFYRVAEGLGESFYFPASMSLLADYHDKRTRSRAMSIHQTSVYLGTIGGGALVGLLAERFGWRSPFLLFGLIGLLYALLLVTILKEPPRGKPAPLVELDDFPTPEIATSQRSSLSSELLAVVRHPSAALLIAAFTCANFVAMALVTWLPMFVYTKFQFGVAKSATIGTVFMQSGSLVGALTGGFLADRLVSRFAGGRMIVQTIALTLGAPCVFLLGTLDAVEGVMAAMVGVGLCKGLYDANIFASLYDVVPAAQRGLAAGMMNTIGWVGGLLAPLVIGIASETRGLSLTLATTAAVYLAAAFLVFLAATLAARWKG